MIRRLRSISFRSLGAALGLVFLLSLAACAGILGIKPGGRGGSGGAAGEHPFEHRAHSMAGIACVTCHDVPPSSPSAVAEREPPIAIPSPKTCTNAGCHAKPHDARSCDQCHGESHRREEARMAREHLRFEHKRHVSRLSGQCVPCHAAAGKADEATTLRPLMATCFGCHAHKDQWKTRDCDGCHHDLPAEHVQPSSHVVHDGDFTREHGVRAASQRDLCATCHSESSCAACHGVTVPALPSRLAFDQPTQGGKMTTGLHRAGFLSRHSEEARANPGLCATCHGDGGGEGARFCLDCHTRRNRASASAGAFSTPVRNPHPAGWVRARNSEHGRAARMDPMSCASCHGGPGEALCVSCHRVGGPGGNPHGRGFASILDPKRDEPCRQCHVTTTITTTGAPR